MAQVRIFSHETTWIGTAAQIDQIGGLINLSRDCASNALRIPCVGDELMGFPEEYLPSIEVIAILESATRTLTHTPLSFALSPRSRLRMIKHGFTSSRY
jgi:hypothetical protein